MRKIYYLVLCLFVFACSKDEQLTLTDTVEPIGNENVEVQDFMWKAMNFWYFWQDEVANLADDRFENTTKGREEYTAFLASEATPEDFFTNKLQYSEDRFSFFNEDYRELTNSLAGISRSNGLEFGLVKFDDDFNVFGYVRYIVPNSNAATTNIQRGDLFIGVNGTPLTVDNYRTLLFGGDNSYTLNMADFIDGTIVPNQEEVSLQKEEGLAENPVFISKFFEIGNEKIGYLMYNQFTNEYDDDLYQAILSLKSSGITNLILDLRYNPGGSVNTTRLLASMIYGTNTANVFLRKRYNDKIQEQLTFSQLEVFFADKINDTPITSLELPKVYVLTSNSSASASELLINCLAPYMGVIQIGDTTRGKNEFSTTMVDDRENNYLYDASRINKINPENQWAIQPLIGRNENAEGFFDYVNGLQPDIFIKEDYGNLGVLGDINEPLLARAISLITNQTSKRFGEVKNPITNMSSSKSLSPMGEKMIDDTLQGFNN